jgi:hypothetical protein
MRLKPFPMPRHTPYFSTACIMYTEQVGSNRHAEGKIGESHRL